jgi:serine/threonine-protein kinase
MSEADYAALIGRRVAGKFLVEKYLGGGAMGAVYRARDTSLERNVALKVMHPAIAIDPSFVTRFHREARAASRLDHPNSMRVIEFGEEPDGLLYIAMEYLEGRDLYKVIHEDWPLPEARIADIMMKALAAAAVAHDMGVIHRDLKPENIMILNRKDDEGQDIVKVCDFGIAKITEKEDGSPGASTRSAGARLTTAGLVVGTPEYMSPEQARGEKLDSRSDLYSMGIILYQLLTGRTPFLADTALAVVLKHLSDPPEPPSSIYPEVHKGLEAVCLRSLAKAKEERFQSARDMRAAIKAAIEGRPMPVETQGTAAEKIASSPPAPNGTPPQTAPMVSSIGPDGRAVVAAIPRASSKVTPLGTAQAPSEDKPRSRTGMVAGVALGALVLGAVGLVLFQKDHEAKSNHPVASPSGRDSTSAGPIKFEVRPTESSAPSNGEPSPQPGDSKGAPKRSTAPSSKTSGASDPRSSSQSSGSDEPELVPVEPQPAPVASASAAPSATPAPAFNAASCRAALGSPKSAGGYNVKDLTLRTTEAAWTSCAKSSIKERPAGSIAATVRVRFNVNRSFKAATCADCPAPLATCVASSTGKSVAFSAKPGEASGDPEFDVPVTFSCE